MKNIQIFYPIFPIVVLHLYAHIHLWINAYKAIKSREVKYRYFRVYKSDAPDYLKSARDHYKNFSEQPVLFYLLCVLLFITENVTTLDIYLAWGYAFFKFIHSYIRFTSNYVPHRAKAFYACFIILSAGWIRFLIGLF
ncbi:MAG: MAPEG family protein [Candidatus Marinimicrobia bacterium]|jgi:hypothetical protein|nr:MAPEG family protein [Candidatus Neomarinimicrobiota bacterium]